MKRNYLFIAAVVLLGFATAVFAGGTTASFLKLGSGARTIGLGDAFTAVSGDISSISYNPAGLANIKKNEMGFTRSELVDGVNYNSLCYSKPAVNGVFGLGINYLSQSSIEGRGANREVTGKFGASDTAINLAYGRKLSARSGLGLNLKYITSRISDEYASGWAIDVGWQYKALIKGLSIGLAMQNLGPKMKFMDEGSALPLTARAGMGYMVLDNILLSFDVNRQVNDKKTVFSFGSEYALFSSLFIRAGYLKNAVSGGSILAANDGFKAGFGFKLSSFNLDYAVTPFGDIGRAHTVSLGVGF